MNSKQLIARYPGRTENEILTIILEMGLDPHEDDFSEDVVTQVDAVVNQTQKVLSGDSDLSEVLPQSQAIAIKQQISTLSVRDKGQQEYLRSVIESEIASTIAIYQIRQKVREGVGNHLQSSVDASAIASERKRSQGMQQLASGDGVQKILDGYGFQETSIEGSSDDRDFIKNFIAAVNAEDEPVDFIQAYIDEVGL